MFKMLLSLFARRSRMMSPYNSTFVDCILFSSIFHNFHRLQESIIDLNQLLESTLFNREITTQAITDRSIIMPFSTTSSQQATKTPSHKSFLGTYNLGQVTSKILQKMKLLKGKESLTLEESSSAEIQAARFVTFTRPTDAPQIIDLQALKRNISQRTVPKLRLHTSLRTVRSSTEMGTPLLKDPQQVPVLEATSDRSATAASDDDLADYEMLDDGNSDVDWTLLDLPEAVYGRLANESRHSLI